VRLLLLAPPGAGQGTQGERLAARHAVRHIAAGDLLRAEARAGTAAGREIAAYQARGDLVPDQIVLDALTPAVVEAADVIWHRLRVFAETTGPLVPYYTERGILVPVAAAQPPDSVTADIQARLSGLRLTRLRGHEGGARI
jgi:adenylate kinase family enzyme